MKTFKPVSGFTILAAALLLIAGCATPTTNSYNDDFNQNLPAAPRYRIKDISEHKFKIYLNQSKLVGDEARVQNIREAASVIAKNEALQRNWENWDMNFIQEGSASKQGIWTATAVVKRKPQIRYDNDTRPGGI